MSCIFIKWRNRISRTSWLLSVNFKLYQSKERNTKREREREYKLNLVDRLFETTSLDIRLFELYSNEDVVDIVWKWNHWQGLKLPLLQWLCFYSRTRFHGTCITNTDEIIAVTSTSDYVNAQFFLSPPLVSWMDNQLWKKYLEFNLKFSPFEIYDLVYLKSSLYYS